MATLPPVPGPVPPAEPHALGAAQSRRALSAFLLFGILTSALGALLPSWGYHLEPDLTTAATFFLCLNVGLLVAVCYAHRLRDWKGPAFTMVTASMIACVAFLLLGASPLNSGWRIGAGITLLGISAGLLSSTVFHVISPLYFHDRAATTTLAGTLYGLGCFLTALLVAGTYYVYSVQGILVLFAIISALYIPIFSRGRFHTEHSAPPLPLRHVLEDFKNPGAVLFALILFFQFGNEWAIAGWLPLFLIRRLGISPESSLFMLTFYWGSLMVGRIVAKSVLNSVGHGKLLIGSILLALLGMVILSYTPNRFGANTGILFIGCGFASIYPLVVEKIGHRFTHYHPGIFNGLFSFAITGGLLSPFLLGLLAQWFGLGTILIVPMAGTFLVFLLVLLVMLDTKLSGDFRPSGARA